MADLKLVPSEPSVEDFAREVDEAAEVVANLETGPRKAAERLREAVEATHKAALVMIVRRLRADEAAKAALYELVDDPVVHLVPANVADHVIDVQQTDRTRYRIAIDGTKTRKEWSCVFAAFDKGVDGVAVGADARYDNLPVLVGQNGWFGNADRAPSDGFLPCSAGIVHPESNDANCISVSMDMFSNRTLTTQRSRQRKTNLPLLHHVSGTIALPSLWSRIGHQGHAESGSIEVGSLTGIAYVEFDVIGSLERQKICTGRCCLRCKGRRCRLEGGSHLQSLSAGNVTPRTAICRCQSSSIFSPSFGASSWTIDKGERRRSAAFFADRLHP